MNRLFVDLYFRGMLKMIFEENDSSFFRGINRVAQEYARRLPTASRFQETHLFGSRLPSLAKGSFQFAGVNGLTGPNKPLLRESLLSLFNGIDRKISNILPVSSRKAARIPFAAIRRLLVIGIEQDYSLQPCPTRETSGCRSVPRLRLPFDDWV